MGYLAPPRGEYGFVDVTPERFDELVSDALDAIPDEFARRVHNLVVLVEEQPPPEEPADLLGRYDGRGLTQDSYAQLPAQILLFRRPLLEVCRSEAELVAEIRTTVIHELGHHFGLDDARLHELGCD